MLDLNNTLLIGSKNGPEEPGIFLYRGQEKVLDANGVEAPGYLAPSKSRAWLYAISVNDGDEQTDSGAIAALKLEGDTYRLVNQESVRGAGPTHVHYAEDLGILLVSNYGGGSVSLHPVGENGEVKPLADYHVHEGSGPNPNRQDAPHVHFVGPSADPYGFYAVDLGTDTLYYYEYEADGVKLIPRPEKNLQAPAGSGPRHYVLDSENPHILYVLCELSSEMLVLDSSQAGTEGAQLQLISMLPEDCDTESKAGAIKLSPDGKFLYGTNRGYDSIAVFSVDAGSDEPLNCVQVAKLHADHPRDMYVGEDVVYTANLESNSISLLDRDVESGKLSNPREIISINEPSFVKIL